MAQDRVHNPTWEGHVSAAVQIATKVLVTCSTGVTWHVHGWTSLSTVPIHLGTSITAAQYGL